MVRRETLHTILTLCLCLVNIDAAPMDVQRRADGSVLLDDMLYSAEQWDSFLDKNLLSMESLWPKKDGVVNIFYKISDPEVNETAANLAIAAWEAKTCIKFSKMAESDERSEYMEFWLDKTCHSKIGYMKGKSTKVSLANCKERGPTHEIGHALGMKHEQARSDRDDNIIVYMANIEPGMKHNYDKAPTINFEVPYDYYSLMQYHDRSYGIDGKRVMLAKDVRFQTLMGEGNKIAHWNAKLMNTMYGCIDDWLKACKQESEPCKNGGYTQKDCSCACPLGTTGDKCENLVMSYRDALIKQFSPYTSVISTSGAEVVSPGYPDKAPSTKTQYTQVFRAEKCQRAVVTFQDFQIEPRSASKNRCGFSYLEIRSDVSVPEGKIFCGEEIEKGTAFKSDKSELILHYMNNDYTKFGKENKYRGYKATFTTEAIPTCS